MAAKKKAKKKIAKKKTGKRIMQAAMSAEELAKGLRGRGGHLPTKASEALRKRRMKKRTKKTA